MKTNDNSLVLPPAILDLVEATCTEKMLLALYLAEPEAKNHRALRALSVGASGLKKIKRRLMSKGWLRPTGTGNRVLVPGLGSAPSEGGGHLVSKSNAIEKENKVALPRRQRTAEEILLSHDEVFEMLTQQPGAGFGCTILRLTESTLRDLQSDLPDGPLKDKLVAEFTTRCNAFYALNYASTDLPRKYHRELGRLIANASPEQLAKLRQGIVQAQLAGGKPTFLLEHFPAKLK